jgi:hypothetical protein
MDVGRGEPARRDVMEKQTKVAGRSALLVAKAAYSKLGKAVTGGAIGTALTLMLSIGGCSQSHYQTIDADGDGYYAGEDCNDENASVHPGAFDPECPDGVDQNCDGHDGHPDIICNYFPEDLDGDGYPRGLDCNDYDPLTYPGAPEDCCEGIDRNCDGSADICTNCFPWVDEDGDGYPSMGFGPVDCDDLNPAIHPGAPELCYDGVDQNCDGVDAVEGFECPIVNPLPDADGDGFTIDVDCDDTRSWIHPDAVEECFDSLDNDCDGTVDEAPPGGCMIINGMLDADDDDGARPA